MERMAQRWGWRRIIVYHVLHWDVIVLRLAAGQPGGSNGCHLLVVRRPRVPKRARAAMLGSSGVQRRKETNADDYGYGWRNSLYSNGGRRRDGRVVPE